MGRWEITPTGSDAAHDWLETFFAESKLEARLHQQLTGNIHEEPDEIRAAAHVVKTLIQADLWPSETRRQFQDLATRQLQRMLDEKVFGNALLVAEIRGEIRQFGGLTGPRR